MPELVSRVSPLRFAWGTVCGLVIAVFAWALHTHGESLVALSLLLLALLSSAQGVKPLGETVFFELVGGAVFVFIGLSMFVIGGLDFPPVGLGILGVFWVVKAGRKASQQGLWAPANPR